MAEEELRREQLSSESNLSTADVAEVESVLYGVLRSVELSARAEAAAEQQKMKQTKPPPPLKATFAKMKRVELLKAARARADEIHALKTTLVKQSTRLEVLLEQKDEEVLTTMNELVARYEQQELELLRERLLTFDECAERCAEGGLADLPSVLAESIVGGHIGMGSFYLRATDDLAAAAPAVAAVVTPAAAAAKKRAHAQDEVHAQDELEGGPTEDGMDAALHALNDKSRLAAAPPC